MEAQRYPHDYDGIVWRARRRSTGRSSTSSSSGARSLMNAASNPVAVVQARRGDRRGRRRLRRHRRREGRRHRRSEALHLRPEGARRHVGRDVRRVHRGRRRRSSARSGRARGARDGSFLWYGLPRGADFSALSGERAARRSAGAPFAITLDWFRYFLTQNPAVRLDDAHPARRTSSCGISRSSSTAPSSAPTTRTCRRSAIAAARSIIWHGWADQLIYRRRDDRLLHARAAGRWAARRRRRSSLRLFLAPGVGHCAGGPGPAADRAVLDALVAWVEDGKAPETLTAVRRDQSGAVIALSAALPVPARRAIYKGTGSTDEASSFTCRAGF